MATRSPKVASLPAWRNIATANGNSATPTGRLPPRLRKLPNPSTKCRARRIGPAQRRPLHFAALQRSTGEGSQLLEKLLDHHFGCAVNEALADCGHGAADLRVSFVGHHG